MINKLYFRKAVSLLCTLSVTAAVLQSGGSAEAMFSSSYLDTESVLVTIDPTDTVKSISPYIYGINAESDLSGVTVNAVKQTDPRVSSYNWENNFSNSGTGNVSSNGAELIGTYPPGRWGDPALYTEYLVTKAKRYGIPSRYVTLQMMGMVSADDAAEIYAGDVSAHWNSILFSKADSYLSLPNINDSTVYIDEYISYLVNSYGYAVDGGINGYFLDNEPENWAERFPGAVQGQITADELINNSSMLASAVKRIDPTALVYGPSVSGIEAFTSLKNPDDWEQYSRDFSWFIDYYLIQMNEASRTAGMRLLDVLDVHYHTEATNGLLAPVISGTDTFSNNNRMQAPRILWDSTYTENSTIAILHSQHIPLIPTLEASINMYYPGTKLSFSEYNFGGGDHISGGIATADTLGIFAKYGVHMACLKPNTENIDYHKSAINIYTNYDGMGSRFGTTLVEADNSGDIMSSVYSAIDGDDLTSLKTVLINKNQTAPKNAIIDITSPLEYESAEIYRFNSESAEITPVDIEVTIEDNHLELELEPLSVYMLVLSSSAEEIIDDGSNGEEIIDTPIPDDTDVSEETQGIVTEPSVTTVTTTETTPPEHVSAETFSSAGTTVYIDEGLLPDESTDVPDAPDSTGSDEDDESSPDDPDKEENPDDKTEETQVPKAVKITVCILLGLVVVTMIYVVFATGKKPSR